MIAQSEHQSLWDETGSQATHMQAEMLQRVSQGPPGYRLRRIILTNFWLYDHQEFEIPHGRLFLAGDNRSGKSTVLTAAITLALDGDYRPERIDTFGKREKRIDYYILGSLESQTPYVRESRTSYIALEFEWCDPDHPPFASELRARWERGEREGTRFFTIGLTFHGNRNSASPVTALRFLITDGKRLEYDIPTVVATGTTRHACDLKTFKKVLVEHGIICNTQHEYEQKVASYLFNFSNVNDFRRLIRQLLYLRQPHLSSVLSLDTVRSFLDQSLPALPADLVQHAANTLEIMEALKDEIERRKQAFEAVERLHKAQQIVTMAHARLAACEHIHAQHRADETGANVRRIKGAITRAENEIRRAITQIAELEEEQSRLEGQLAALKDSEGLQAVQRINELRGKVADLNTALQQQQQALDDCIRHHEQTMEQIKSQSEAFEQARQLSTQLLGTLQTLAAEQARWQLAADQLTDLLAQMRPLSPNVPSLEVTAQVSTLQEVFIQERLKWLHALKQLHRDLAHITAQLQIMQQQETVAYDALDEATRGFERARANLCLAQQDLAESLDTLLDQSDWQPYLTRFIALHEQAALTWNEATSPEEIVQQLGAIQQEYVGTIRQTLDALGSALTSLQTSIEEVKGAQAVKKAALDHAREIYEQKQREPEYVPYRSDHRRQARERLAAAGVAALPLYMLLDFAPFIGRESAEAGRLEYLLEDAGLLDALVVLPSHCVTADAILSAEGLSDCRIDSEQLKYVLEQKYGQSSAQIGQSTLLCIDPVLRDIVGAESARWEETAQSIVQVLEQQIYPALTQSKAWSHGLLRGIAGEGTARCIGKATRLREKQRELELLWHQCSQLENELTTIDNQLTALMQQRNRQVSLREQLGRMLQERSGEEQHATLKSSFRELVKARNRYQQEHEGAQKLRRQVNTLKIRLQQETIEIPAFAVSSESIEQAQNATHRLASEYKTVLSYLDNLRTSWQARRAAQTQLDQDQAAVWRAEQAKQGAERELATANAHLETLERLVNEQERTEIAALLARQHALLARQHSLPSALQTAREQRVRAETTLSSKQEEYREAVAQDEQARKFCEQTYERLLAIFDMYPAEMLIAMRQQVSIKSRLTIAEDLLSEPLELQEEAYHQMKSKLEKHLAENQNKLFRIVSEVNSALHEYGPQFDDLGIIRFLNADRANALELLTRLGEELQHQEQLLEVRERELFQNFLLEEMADTVGKHIAEAERWVERMNNVLSQTAFVGEYYRLKWVSRKPEQERGQPISRLAQYHDLLRRQAQTFKQEEIDALVHAFRQEINALETRANSPATFTETLAQILDYRTWFQFELYLTHDDRPPQHLTNRFFKKGSGAEQFAMLYIPFFASLSALYESAGTGAPRLIALDEAFEKVSQENTRNLLKFLVAQRFQWIMSGPRVTGEGAEIPACVKYTMFCQKEKELAAGFPSFWSAALPVGSTL